MTRTTESCPYCNRQCMTEQLLALHKGHEHPDILAEMERTDYEKAIEREREALRIYQLKALLVVTTLYFGFLFAYRVI